MDFFVSNFSIPWQQEKLLDFFFEMGMNKTRTFLPTCLVGLFFFYDEKGVSGELEKATRSPRLIGERSTSLGPELLKDVSFGSENQWSSYMKDIGILWKEISLGIWFVGRES